MASGRAELRKLIKDFGKIPPDLRRELRRALRKAAVPVLGQMRANSRWSSRIPAATKISIGLSGSKAGVTLRTNAKRAPHGRPFEHGGSAGNFRHKVFGHKDRWVAQRARPFFFNAADQRADDVRDSLGDTVIDVAKRHGF
jgi:hypothetical protein